MMRRLLVQAFPRLLDGREGGHGVGGLQGAGHPGAAGGAGGQTAGRVPSRWVGLAALLADWWLRLA